MNDVSGGAGKGGQKSPRGGSTGVSGAQFAGVGLQFALTIVVFAFAGIWLDKRLGTSPWMVILGVFIGAAAGFFSIYRQLMGAQARGEKPRTPERGKDREK